MGSVIHPDARRLARLWQERGWRATSIWRETGPHRSGMMVDIAPMRSAPGMIGFRAAHEAAKISRAAGIPITEVWAEWDHLHFSLEEPDLDIPKTGVVVGVFWPKRRISTFRVITV